MADPSQAQTPHGAACLRISPSTCTFRAVHLTPSQFSTACCGFSVAWRAPGRPVRDPLDRRRVCGGAARHALAGRSGDPSRTEPILVCSDSALLRKRSRCAATHRPLRKDGLANCNGRVRTSIGHLLASGTAHLFCGPNPLAGAKGWLWEEREEIPSSKQRSDALLHSSSCTRHTQPQMESRECAGGESAGRGVAHTPGQGGPRSLPPLHAYAASCYLRTALARAWSDTERRPPND